MVPSNAPAERRLRLVPIAVIVVAAAMRIALNDVTTFSDADETHYLRTARALAPSVIDRYPAVAAEYVSHPSAWRFPSLLRWASHGVAATACRVRPACSERTLASLSTAAGIIVVLLAYAIGRARLDERAAVLGAAFVAVSPLQLALGRRALQDELVCASVLLAIWTAMRVLDAPAGARVLARYVAAIVAASIAFATKETFVLYGPAFVALWLFARERRGGGRRLDAALLVAPPLAFYGGYCLLTRTTTQFFEMARIAVASLGFDYARQYQSGPPHRYLVDLLALSPASVLLALGAIAVLLWSRGRDARGPAELATFTALALAVFSLVSKNVRFVAALDALICLLAAWFVVALAERARRPRQVIVVAAVALTVSNLWLFDRVFLNGQVDDPTTYEIFRALKVIPP